MCCTLLKSWCVYLSLMRRPLQAKWSLAASAGTKQRAEDRAVVRIVGRQPLECRSTTWVSETSLRCVVPPVPLVSQPVDQASRSLVVNVAIVVAGRQNEATSHTSLTYTDVPAYFSCDNNRVFGNSRAQGVCYKCCRPACIKDAISAGSPLAGFVFNDCEGSCSQYCGYSSVMPRPDTLQPFSVPDGQVQP